MELAFRAQAAVWPNHCSNRARDNHEGHEEKAGLCSPGNVDPGSLRDPVGERAAAGRPAVATAGPAVRPATGARRPAAATLQPAGTLPAAAAPSTTPVLWAAANWAAARR